MVLDAKTFTSRFRIRFQDLNPNINATKMQPYVLAKYREFQELAKNYRFKSASSLMREASARESNSNKDQGKVPSLKIRISTRRKRRNQDSDGENSDQEFEREDICQELKMLQSKS